MADSSPLYWAVLLDEPSKTKLLSNCPPKHDKVYAEHMTIAFNSTDLVNCLLQDKLGRQIQLDVVGRASDSNGDAVVIHGESRIDDGIPHITISCSGNTKPFYSNQLLSKGWQHIDSFTVNGIIAAYIRDGIWVKG